MIKQNTTYVQDITFDNLYDFVEESQFNGNKNKTINKRINILKCMIKFGVQRKHCDPSIIVAFPKLSEEDVRYQIVDVETMNKVINYLLKLYNSPMELRNKLVIFLFVDTGARLSEVTNIQVSNINFNHKSILLSHTKTNKQRYVYFTKITAKYLKLHIKNLDDRNNALLRNIRSNEPLTYLGVIRITQKIKDVLGLENFSSHMIRHSYGTLAYELDVRESFTTRSMGHHDRKMTTRYEHINLKKDSELYSKLEPMNYYLKKNRQNLGQLENSIQLS